VLSRSTRTERDWLKNNKRKRIDSFSPYFTVRSQQMLRGTEENHSQFPC